MEKLHKSLIKKPLEAPHTGIYFGITSNGGSKSVVLATRGVIGGGQTAIVNTMDYITIATTGDADDFGDLQQARYGIASVYSDTRGVFCAGYSGSYHDTMDYITTLTTGDASTFGALSSATYSIAGVSNLTRGCMTASVGSGNRIDYITIATTGDSSDFANLTVSRTLLGGNVNSETRGVFFGGHASFLSVMDYITIDTIADATTFGDLTVGRYSPAGLSSETRGVMFGGLQTGSSVVNTIDYITIATTGSADDFGDLVGGDANAMVGGMTNDTRGCMCGHSSSKNNIDYITIDTQANSTDFGDLTDARNGGGGVSG